jgi:photosystem II stability/assembly factor-like uncharacterized protein
MKNCYFILLLFCFACWVSCTKSTLAPKNGNAGGAPDPNVYKLTLIDGSGQTDTVGNPLQKPLLVKVTVNGIATSGYTVKFVGSGCAITDTLADISAPDGTATYKWSLAGDLGQQQLHAYLLNSKGKTVDSVQAIATAISPGPGWHNSACSVQYVGAVTSFAKLSSGRLFVAFYGNTFLRYSDDGGASWYAVRSLGNQRSLYYVASSPANELYAFTSDGTFYSSDGGQTWANQGKPPFNPELINGVAFSRTSQLFVTGVIPTLAISSDKGKTWTQIHSSAIVAGSTDSIYYNYFNPIVDANGNIYLTEKANEILYKSTDGGVTWAPQLDKTSSFFIDPAGQYYQAMVYFNGGIFISKDQGATYNQLSFFNDAYINNMSVQPDGNFYFDATGLGVYRLVNGSTVPQLLFPDNVSEFQPYIVGTNGDVVIANIGHFYIRYLSK